MSRSLRSRRAVAALLAALALSGCSAPVAMTAAENATDPRCADVVVRLPEVIDELEQRETNAQATSAWGDPAAVLLRCGLEPVAASPLPCVQVEDVYWLREGEEGTVTFTTFGRDPAVQVVVDRDRTSPGLVLFELHDVLSFTEPTGQECTDVEDSLVTPGQEGATPSPSPSAPAEG
ncbi:DUF3515 family protein [Herbiconiux sp. SYSU D00978]|uniref:DUF3515 family protein n=1 Tax=Herbiconiux sp. SYSU D00978 TaxID=2812562 RepID=UPI001A96021E|nr:DUF3515 family protein [Herbiconiux sp. SYSU D00978]